jgi:putative salt-induced outer membrane protein YdiY
MKKYFFILISMLTIEPSFGQVVNIESQRIHTDTTGWDGTLEAGFAVNQNNTLLVSATANSHVQYKTRKDVYMLLGNWRFTNGGTSRFVNDGMAHFRYNHKFTKWLRLEAFTQVQYNQLLNLRLRYLVGMGPRFKMLDKSFMQMYSGVMYMFEYEVDANPDTVQYNNRLTSYISWTIDPNPHFSFVATTYYQPKLTDWRDFRISGNYALRFKAFRRLAFKIEFNFLYDSEPPVGIQPFVFNGTTGIVFNLRK